MKNKFLLLATALVLSTTATFASNNFAISNLGMSVSETDTKSDMIEQVRSYMLSYNIEAVYICEEAGTSNYLGKDSDGIWYRVFVQNGIVVGMSEADL